MKTIMSSNSIKTTRAIKSYQKHLNMLLATKHHIKLLLCSVLLLITTQLQYAAAGSCRDAQLCCNGRDSSCVVQKAPVNAIIEDLNDKPCYCDHACLKLGDCCNDFKDHCGVTDCQVSDWGQWSDCDNACGSGMMSRTRTIQQPAQNGGKHCPSLLQKRECQGFRCHGHHDKKLLREKALLLPASMSFKHHDKHYHNNNNNNNKNSSKIAHEKRYSDAASNKYRHEQEYCVEFEVLRTSKTCRKLPPYNLLLEGDRIVVRCDVEALVEDNTEFMDMNEHAHRNNSSAESHKQTQQQQQWQMTEEPTEDEDGSDENQLDGSDENDDYAAMQTTTTTTTTTTQRTPQLPLTLSYHCRGEGLAGRTTHWSALPAPSCRGKWLRLTVGTPKKCTHAQFMFV